MVILPTALGKTVISALAAAYFLSNHWNMKILVLAPIKPLVFQHKDTLKKVLRIKAERVVVLAGKVPPSYRTSLWEGMPRFFLPPKL